MAEELARGQLNGTLSLVPDSFDRPDLDVTGIRMFRLVKDANGDFQAEELTDLFRCDYAGVNSSCVLRAGFLP